ncbi:MAG TPA: gamma-glutamyl-gamma-aminobutyrate hydrolase family protein [Devosia sp.]|nr:gamma-glutamyl-gamma-aminobutyrate hydrolase family protein [Devosia sp.]
MGENRPIVGVIACGREVEGEPAQAVKHRYLEAVTRYAQAIPLIVPTNQPLENAGDIVARLDAILLTGSNSNIVPQRYGSSAEARLPRDDARDAFSAALIHAAIAAKKPVFGICRGLQEINVALGGSLRDMREHDNSGELHHAAAGASLGDMFGHGHDLHVRPDSQLARITGSNRMTVNSVHYQTIDRLADGLRADATGPDGVIEAISSEGSAAPVFAVQWHPEWRTAERPADQAFFACLGEAARAAAEARS